ncbi:cation:H+ antiporter [Pseudobutyrivibrio sp. OR37]|uniref:calcium/sodium antiporter n=1 Tax=Pseudobutyrivibrio sp. OR37 TaxID=1798186 RepID=UPI0008F443F3|nr:calcium/sodium antiporter [Pseudobutyrivibrio sp. OR37]SFH88552.1 cation:H+ antiporter [Pseudobutyrivibrio sp. OR37]
MIFNIFLLMLGFIALVKGADWFVLGSSDVAKNLKVPSLIIGLTIVAFGTSAPELAVSLTAAIEGANEISVSNVVGSNIFNILIVLGVCAIIKPLTVDNKILKRDMPISIIITVFTLIACINYSVLNKIDLQALNVNENVGMVYRWVGIALLIGFVAYLYLLIRVARNSGADDDNTDSVSMLKCIVLIIIGLALVIGGGKLVVDNAKELARMAGMTETLIGVTIVAAGTSLPELVTSIVAARKGETGLAIGNVVGSNIFNLLFILGISGAISPMGVNLATIIDFIILIVCTIITYIYSRTSQKIVRWEGAIMVMLYVVYVGYAILRH